MLIGLVIYFVYGARHSVLGAQNGVRGEALATSAESTRS
jgi:hypothetical protein